jgi:acetyltransferase
MAEVLAKQPRPKGPRLTIVTNAGGPGVLATDMLIGSGGATGRAFAGNIKASTRSCRPPGATTIRWTSSATPARNFTPRRGNRRQRSEHRRHAGHPHAAGDDRPDRHGRMPQAFAHIRQTDHRQLDGRRTGRRGRGHSERRRNSHLQISRPRAAFYYMWRYSENLRRFMKRRRCSTTISNGGRGDREKAAKIIADVRKSGRTILTEFESKQLLAAYGIPTVETHIARTEARR